jgi:hypothetical protein
VSPSELTGLPNLMNEHSLLRKEVNMHGHRHFRGRPGFRGHRRFPSREEWLRRLEKYQRDLEQELADVADVIRHLQGDQPADTATV